MLYYSNGTPYKAELGLGLGWGCSVLSARLTHSVKLIHIKNYECEAHSQLRYECEAHSHLSYYCYVMGVKLIRILNYECVRIRALYTLYTCIYVEMDSVYSA